jgi:solute carrier family 27 fatty acid transporter 1/4
LSEISSAGTFKLKKQDLQVEGFNPHHIKDQLYFLMGGQYVPLTEKLFGDIINGRFRL